MNFHRNYCSVLSIDFDETIVNSNYPVIHSLKENAKEYINRLYDEGYYIIIWTCRSKDEKQNAANFLRKEGVKFHCINKHHPYFLKLFKGNTRKILADLYIDDKCLFELPPWEEIYKRVKQRTKNIKSVLTYE
jgi:hypothetical protein